VGEQRVIRHRRRWPVAVAALVAFLLPVLVSATGTSASVEHAAKTPKPYHPPRVKSVFARPLRGEGVWHPTGPNYKGGPPVLVTVFRGERDYPQILAWAAWFDHTRTSIAFYPGRYEPPNAAVRGPMMVPTGQRWRLLATFNAGFTHQYSGDGSSINGKVDEPLKQGEATLVGYKTGGLAIIRWHGGAATSKRAAWARQSLPPIVWNGKLNPALDNSKLWGEAYGPSIRVWRTGVGLDSHGNLIFVVAEDQTVITLARIMQRVGAVRAMEFDINSFWHTLITYTHKGGLHPTLVEPQPNHTAYRYLTPDDRDFFAVYRRLPGNFTVPVK
jgi:hypothetical protein